MPYLASMDVRQEVERFLLAVGWPERAVRAVLKNETAPTPVAFTRLCAKLARGKSAPNGDAWERLLPSTWQGVIVRCLGNDFDGEFPPSAEDYDDAEAQRIAAEGVFLTSADGAELFAVETAQGWSLYELQREEAAKDLGTWADWLREGTRLATGDPNAA
jgi:hypothetical protein